MRKHRQFKRSSQTFGDNAWETEVWVADAPEPLTQPGDL